jgi:hypothetical protein
VVLSTAAWWHVRRVRKGEREQALEALITEPVAAYKLRRLSVLDSSRGVHGLSITCAASPAGTSSSIQVTHLIL